MKLFSEGKAYKLYEGSMLDMLDSIEPESIDSIVTDPPYELNFMNKGWDNSGIAFQKSTWEKCLKVLKPGGYLLSFGGSRTHHRIAVAIEDAGFEIRDCIMWVYGSGFPKSMNIGLAIDKKNGIESPVVGISHNGAGASPQKLRNHERGDTGIGMLDGSGKVFEVKQAQNEYQGWGTQLKPAYEAIIVARKPFEGSCVDNVIKYGVGGINIDECRVPISQSDIDMINAKSSKNPTGNYKNNESKKYGDYSLDIATSANEQGRFPANLILTYDETDKDEVIEGMPNTKSTGGSGELSKNSSLDNFSGGWNKNYDCAHLGGLGDEGSAARYFYCAKATKRDRDEGLDGISGHKVNDGHKSAIDNPYQRGESIRSNSHPCVKPCALMQYLIRLVTSKGGTVLDPFNGSGSTGKAVAYENYDRHAGYKYVGIELSSEYLKISDLRISYVESLKKTYNLLFGN